MRGTMQPPLQALLLRCIDYAGLFPPAALSMEEAIEEYFRHCEGPESFLMTGFICPLDRWDEFESVRNGRPMDVTVLSPYPVGSEEFETGWRQANASPGLAIRSWEGKWSEVEQGGKGLPEWRDEAGRPAFLEVPVTPSWPGSLRSVLEEIRDKGYYAKMRTGGLTPEAIPSAENVAAFILTCSELRLPFKFTAGLHEALYHYDEKVGTHLFGFLNVLLGSVAALMGGLRDAAKLVSLLKESDPASVQVSEDAIRWGDVDLGTSDIEEARGIVRSFGSCSVAEPVESLERLRYLA
ncbi:MAG: hypothetical protein D6724_02780 [Armatimonadetes bacterium]|nr:MAG: hypothetical protein D6724_02780 [Armatimonadota bacterium]